MLLATPAAGAFVPSLPLFGGIGAGVAGRDAIDAAASAPRRSPAALQLQAASAATQQLEAILFDCDGVLADTERDGHRISFNLAFKNNGIDEDWSEERYGKLLEVGGGKERMTAHWVS
jgi:predicted Zn-dependent protease